MNEYNDIINLTRPKSKHPKMSMMSRSGQFAPFAALTGYDDEIKETGRITKQKKELDDETKSILNNKVQLILENIKNKPRVTITYFVKDNKKNGGTYNEITNNVKKIDIVNKTIYLANTKINFDDIINIEL